jgi:hypothetical protein
LLPEIGFAAGEYYMVGHSSSAVFANVEDVTYFTRFYVGETTTFDRIGVLSGNTFSGTATMRLGVYNNNTTNGYPDTVLFDAGTVSVTTSTTFNQITINETINPGWYWFSTNTQTAATTNTFWGSNTYFIAPQLMRTATNLVRTTYNMRETGVSGAFATVNTANLDFIGNNLATVAMRVA